MRARKNTYNVADIETCLNEVKKIPSFFLIRSRLETYLLNFLLRIKENKLMTITHMDIDIRAFSLLTRHCANDPGRSSAKAIAMRLSTVCWGLNILGTTSLGLIGCDLGQTEHVLALCALLKGKKFSTVNLANKLFCKIEPDDVSRLFEALNESETISLDLSQSILTFNFTDTGKWKVFCNCLSKSRLLSLNVSDNFLENFSCANWGIFINAIKTSSIFKMDVSRSKLDMHQLDELRGYLTANLNKFMLKRNDSLYRIAARFFAQTDRQPDAQTLLTLPAEIVETIRNEALEQQEVMTAGLKCESPGL
jgi:hypothetical protein